MTVHTASGLGSLLDNPAGGTANRLIMTSNLGAPWAFKGHQ